MKKLLLLAMLVLSGVAAFAQGTVNFANGASGVNAPITNGVSLARSANTDADRIWVALYIGAANTADATTLTTNGFQGGSMLVGATSAGYFLGGSRTNDLFAGGTQVTLQVRAWFASAGATYEAARGANPSLTGPGFAASNPIQVTLASGLTTPPNLVGLAGFAVPPVPEPSSIALGLLGLGAVALIRRRK
jgi:hypothetical protein